MNLDPFIEAEKTEPEVNVQKACDLVRGLPFRLLPTEQWPPPRTGPGPTPS